MSFEEDEEIEAKCPLSGISCEDCKWKIVYKKYGYDIYGYECFLFALISELHDLNETLSASLEETPVKRHNKR